MASQNVEILKSNTSDTFRYQGMNVHYTCAERGGERERHRERENECQTCQSLMNVGKRYIEMRNVSFG